MAHDLLDRLRERLEELNRSKHKVANVILGQSDHHSPL